MIKPLITILAGSLLLTGCAGSLSGYGGTSTFKCAAPNGVNCNSISGNYANSVAGNKLLSGKKETNDAGSPQPLQMPDSRHTLSSGMPVRTQSEVMRIWMAPWQDNDGDLVDQAYTYVTLNEGRWLIEHNRKQIMDEYQPIRLLGANNNNAAESKEAKPAKSDTVPDILPLPGELPK